MPDPGTPPTSRTAYVVSRLKEDLASGVIQPGEILKQTVIAERYGVSATPVREALRILEADGTIEYSHHRGATVRQLSAEAASDLYRIRAALEREATEMAVTRMDDAARATVARANQTLVDALAAGTATPAELSKLNRELHFAVYRMCSRVVVETLEALWARFPASATLWRDHAATLSDEHQDIVAAIIDGDAERAGRLMAEHVHSAARMRSEDPLVRADGTDQ